MAVRRKRVPHCAGWDCRVYATQRCHVCRRAFCLTCGAAHEAKHGEMQPLIPSEGQFIDV